MTSEVLSHFDISCEKFKSKCNVIIYAVTWSKKGKSMGGDIFLMWAEQTNGDGCSIGDVTDNGNGTYTGVIEFYWRGETVIKVKLGGTLENYCRRKKSMVKYGNSVFANKVPWGIKATYENRVAKEETRCGLHERIQGYPKICNITHLNDGVPWFCGQPRHPKLHCGDLLEYNDGAFTGITGDPPTNSGDVISNFGHGELNHIVTLSQVMSIDQNRQTMACTTFPKRYSWFSTGGYYLNGTWNIPYCESKLSFSKETCRACLENKTVVVLGDSTVRDYASYFLSETMEIPLIDLKHSKSKNNTYHPDSDFKQYGVRIIYKKHELPFHHPHVQIKGVTSVATELIELARNSISGDDLIVLFNYNSHMYAFPPDMIRARLKRIVKAMNILLKVKPTVSVFLRGPHVYFKNNRFFDLRVALVQKDIIFEEFQQLFDKMVYLDVWSITTAFGNEDLHPQDDTMKSQIQQFMSYVC